MTEGRASEKALRRRTATRPDGPPDQSTSRPSASKRGAKRSKRAIVHKRAGVVAPLVLEATQYGVGMGVGMGVATPTSALPLFPDFVPDYEWVLGLVELPRPKRRRGAAVPSAALFLEAGSGLVVHVDLLASVTGKALSATLQRAMDRGETMGLRRPTRIRVGVPDHASLLGEAGRAGVEIVMGPVPEVDEVLRTPGAVKAAALPTIDDVDVWRGGATITDAQLAAFFQAAEELRRGRFWRGLEGDRPPLRLWCPALGLPPDGVVLEALSPRGGLRVRMHEGGSLSIRFDRAGELSSPRRRELAELRFAPRRGPYPVLSPVGEDGRLRRSEAEDYDLATAALLATSRFCSEYGALLRCVSLRALVACYSIRLGRARVVDVELGRSGAAPVP